jgi:hypothetical protein
MPVTAGSLTDIKAVDGPGVRQIHRPEADSLIRIMAGARDRRTIDQMLTASMMPALLSSKKESVMEKRNGLHAVEAESLVFESNFGLANNPATGLQQEAVRRAQWIPAWSAAALVCENIRTDDTTPIVH